MVDSSSEHDRLDELAEEFVERHRRGEHPSLSEYLTLYPEHAEAILQLFPALLKLEQLKPAEPGGPDPTTESTPSPSSPVLNELGDFRILREVGRGGMGIVYEAEQVSLSRHVALKVLTRAALLDPRQILRFRREARAAARLHHTNIVPVFGVGEHDGLHFYVMQFIRGLGLDEVLDELRRFGKRVVRESKARPKPAEEGEGLAAELTVAGLARSLDRPRRSPPSSTREIASHAPPVRLSDIDTGPKPAGSTQTVGTVRDGDDAGSPVATTHRRRASDSSLGSPGRERWRNVVRIGMQVAEALDHAAAQGILHRDIKPSNLLLDLEGTIWVTDFGLAKAMDDVASLTESGDIIGTLRYMASERLRGRGDIRSDICSLGLTLYELLTLRPAYLETDRHGLMTEILRHDPPRPRAIDPWIPRDLETIVLKAIARDPARRYATAAALAEDHRRFLEGRTILARRAGQAEQLWRWCRRNPVIASLAGSLALAFLAMGIQGVWSYRRISRALAAAEAQTYLATQGEADLLRLAHPTGWRDRALLGLSRLTAIDTPGRDLVELRGQAVACLGELDVRELARLKGSKGMIRSLDFSLDGRTLATASEEDDVLLWDLEGRRLMRRVVDPALDPPQFRTPNAPWPSVRFRPDGGLVYATWNRSVAALDSPEAGSPRTFATCPAPVRSVNLDRNVRLVVVGWAYNHIGVFDSVTGTLKRSLEATPMGVLVPVAVSPDGSRLATVGPGGEVLVHDLGRDVPARGLGRLGIEVKALAFSPDGRSLAAAMMDGIVRLWDLPGGSERPALHGHSAAATGVAFSPDGTLVATIGIDQTARLWNARNGLSVQTLKPGIGGLGSVAFSPDGERLAVGSNEVCLYQLVGRHERRRLAGHFDVVRGLAFHPKKPLLASVSADTTAILWDRAPRQWGCNEGRQAQSLAWSPDGSLLATGANTYPSVPGAPPVILWDAEGLLPRGKLPVYDSAVKSLAFDRLGHRLATGFEDGAAVVWDLDRLESHRQVRLGSPVEALAFLGDGSRLVAAAVDGAVVVFDLDQEEPVSRTEVPGGTLAMAVAPGERAVIVAGVDGGIRTLSLPDLKTVHSKPNAHSAPVHGLALSPDGRLLVSGGLDRRVVFRDASNLEPLFGLDQDAPPLRLAFDREGRRLAIAGEENEVTLWDLTPVRSALAGLGLDWGPEIKPPGPRGQGPAEPARPWVVAADPAPAGRALACPRPAGPRRRCAGRSSRSGRLLRPGRRARAGGPAAVPPRRMMGRRALPRGPAGRLRTRVGPRSVAPGRRPPAVRRGRAGRADLAVGPRRDQQRHELPWRVRRVRSALDRPLLRLRPDLRLRQGGTPGDPLGRRLQRPLADLGQRPARVRIHGGRQVELGSRPGAHRPAGRPQHSAGQADQQRRLLGDLPAAHVGPGRVRQRPREARSVGRGGRGAGRRARGPPR
ncbi:MAG: protein kinase [Isosphaerales bacterium]